MSRALLIDLLPWVGTLAVSGVLLALLLRHYDARFDWRRLARLHQDETGAVQSLSFVLTLPMFLMLVMFIVQVALLMIGTMMVHYAAYATGRAALVWIPAETATEPANRISSRTVIDGQENSYAPVTYEIAANGPKYEKIRSAAVLTLLPVSPSRAVPSASGDTSAFASLRAAYEAVTPDRRHHGNLDTRLQNKLSYADTYTNVRLTFVHDESYPGGDPPLIPHGLPEDYSDHYPDEVGWRDPITAEVEHAYALLPGAGALLASIPGRTSANTRQVDDFYQYRITATATFGNEGYESVYNYVAPLP